MKKNWGTLWKYVFFFSVCAAVGAAIGILLTRIETGLPKPAVPLIVALLLLVSLYVQTILHEAGHLVFGLLTGYRFCSFRIGALLLYRSADGLRLGRYSLPGTAGQCLLLPPESGEDLPVALYNLGGCLMNLIVSAIAALAATLCPRGSWGAAALLSLAIVGVGFAAMNGIPLSTVLVDNDGSNLQMLRRSAPERLAFRNQLLVNGALTAGKRLRELPAEWFAMPESFADAKGGVCGCGYLAFCRALDLREDEHAVAIGKRLLNEAKALAGIHRLLVQQELLFLALVGSDAAAGIDNQPDEALRKFWKQSGSLLSTQRMHYAVALLVDCSGSAARAKAAFERIAATYPFTGEAEGEREQLARIDAAVARQGDVPA